MDIASGISATIAAISGLLKLKAELKDAQARELLLDALLKLNDAKAQLLAAVAERDRLAGELARLKDADDVVFHDGFYFRPGDADGPFCPRCRDKDRVLMRVIDVSPALMMVGQLRCPECRTLYKPLRPKKPAE